MNDFCIQLICKNFFSTAMEQADVKEQARVSFVGGRICELFHELKRNTCIT